MYHLLAVVIGVLISIMIGVNGILSQHLGTYSSIVLIHLLGLIVILIIFVIKQKKPSFNRSLPVWLYSAGVIGTFTVLFNVTSFTAIGASLTLSLGLLGESVASTIIDHFGLLGNKVTPFNPKKIAGLILISIGIVIMALY